MREAMLTGTDCWSWWQTRRLRYNIALASAGVAAYATAAVLHLAFGQPLWLTFGEAASETLSLGVGYLVLMGFANIFYLLGPLAESLVRPADPDRFRQSAFGMGFWGSVALPFLFPALALAALIGGNGTP